MVDKQGKRVFLIPKVKMSLGQMEFGSKYFSVGSHASQRPPCETSNFIRTRYGNSVWFKVVFVSSSKMCVFSLKIVLEFFLFTCICGKSFQLMNICE